MGHRLGVASGKNEFDRRLGNFRVQIKLDEGEHVATITASILAPRSLSEHLRSPAILSAVGISTPSARCLAVGGFYFKGSAGGGPQGYRPALPLSFVKLLGPHGTGAAGVRSKKGKVGISSPQAKKKADGAHAIRRPAISL